MKDVVVKQIYAFALAYPLGSHDRCFYMYVLNIRWAIIFWLTICLLC